MSDRARIAPNSHVGGTSIDRRRLFLGAAGSAALAGAKAFGAGAQSPVATPQTGGTLRAAFAGMGAAETLEPWMAGYTVATFQRAQHMYEPLVRNNSGEVEPILAESIEPNTDATIWTVKMRPGITFHSGKPLTANEVWGTFVYHLDPANGSVYAFSLPFIDLQNSRVVDDMTIEFATFQPTGNFTEQLAIAWLFIFDPEWEDFIGSGNGTGPFQLTSFTPGDRALLSRNLNYWGPSDRGPFLDTLELISMDDPQARINALLAGQIDFAENLSPAQAQLVEGNDQIQLVRFDNAFGRSVLGFVTYTQGTPFDNPDVRMAMRYLVDRQALADAIGLGFGEIANDLMFNRVADYNDQLPQREHDPERALALLKAAGQEDLAFDLWTSEVGLGHIEGATLYQSQLAEHGMQARLEIVPPDIYYVQFDKLLLAPMKATSGGASTVLGSIGSFYISSALLNLGGYSNPELDALYAEATATLDGDLRRRLCFDMQELLWNDGPDVVWGSVEVLHAAGSAIRGIDGSDTTQYPFFTGAFFES